VITSTRPTAARGVIALDRASVRTKDRDGRLHVSLSNISKASVDPYYGREIPDGARLGLDPDTVYYMLRSPEELALGAATFNNLPILSRHIPVNAAAPRKEITVGSTGTDAAYNAPYLQNSAVIWDQEAIDEIESGEKREWSCGYYYEADMTPGEFGGLRYDGNMRSIVGNHVALVDAGRAGPDVVVGDEMPRGLVMRFNSRVALMLNGALAAAIAPKLAMDAKLDLSPLLSGVNRKTIGNDPAKLAASVCKLAAPKLAQDAELDADDVCKVIAAVNGAAGGIGEDEDNIPEEDADKDAPALDADADKLAQVMAFIEGKLSDEDMAELGALVSGGAVDEEIDDEDKPAMDAAAIKRTVATALAELRTAEREVAPLIGEVKVACDSGAAVYKLALDHAGVNTTGVHPSAFRSMVAMLKNRGVKASPKLAHDRASVVDDFRTLFPGAGRLIAS